jgi:predicted branched-subunit amino acid permease
MSEPSAAISGTPTGAFVHGARVALTSVFAFVILFTYIGFGAMAHDYGFSVGWAMLSTALQWAGPAQVILVTGLGPGTVLIETAVAVALSSVRLLPIVVALLPLVKREDQRRTRGPGNLWSRRTSWRSASGSRRCGTRRPCRAPTAFRSATASG